MSTLITILIILGIIGFPFGIMQCAAGGPLAPVIFPFCAVISGAGIVLYIAYCLLNAYFSPVFGLFFPKSDDDKEYFNRCYKEELHKIKEQKKKNKKSKRNKHYRKS